MILKQQNSTQKKMTQKTKKIKSLTSILEPWLELDLTAAAKAGTLEPAYEIDDLVERVGCLLEIGRNPVLLGDSGVGKTAVVHELVRRGLSGEGPARLRRTRVLQISLQRRASSLKDTYLICEEMQKLVEALRRTTRRLALFIRDLSLAYEYDLEPQLAALAYAFRGPLIGEGTEADVTTLLESDPCLRQHFMTVRIDEPSFDKSRVILRSWAQGRRETTGQIFSTSAVEQALLLSHRFLTRGRLPRKAIEILDQSATLASDEPSVTEKEVFERFCMINRTPRVLVDPAIPLDIDRLRQQFTDRVVGQDDAIDIVTRMISVIKAGLSDDRRPLGVFLWTGPSGVGKTYVAQLLAEHLFGHRDRMVRLNMADYQQATDAGTLFGQPGSRYIRQQSGVLTRRLMSMPFGILLLDEFEKAHTCVHDRFLQMFDEGSFINGEHEIVSCRSWILVATSNAGWEPMPGSSLGFTAGDVMTRRTRADIAMERYFRPVLLNRFDRIVHFLPLEMDHYRMIVDREIERLGDRIGIEQRRLNLHTHEGVVDWILSRGDNRDQGVRFLRRMIESHVTSALADLIVRMNPPPGSSMTLEVENDRIVARMTGCEEPRDVPGQDRHAPQTGVYCRPPMED
ncbi:MAG: AAA family ATPase [Phycisphaerae bacterium]